MPYSLNRSSERAFEEVAGKVLAELLWRVAEQWDKQEDHSTENILEGASAAMFAIGVRAAILSPEWARALVVEIDKHGVPEGASDEAARRMIESRPVTYVDREVA